MEDELVKIEVIIGIYNSVVGIMVFDENFVGYIFKYIMVIWIGYKNCFILFYGS